jgi:hypothetical protein
MPAAASAARHPVEQPAPDDFAISPGVELLFSLGLFDVSAELR